MKFFSRSYKRCVVVTLVITFCTLLIVYNSISFPGQSDAIPRQVEIGLSTSDTNHYATEVKQPQILNHFHLTLKNDTKDIPSSSDRWDEPKHDRDESWLDPTESPESEHADVGLSDHLPVHSSTGSRTTAKPFHSSPTTPSDHSFGNASLKPAITKHIFHKNIPVTPDQQTMRTRDRTPRTQVIIVTSKRTGSSFVGELFNANPNVFYVYEPLFLPMKYVMNDKSSIGQFAAIARHVWNHTLRCNFTTTRPSSRSWLWRGDDGFDSCESVRAIRDSPLLCPIRNISDSRIGSLVSNVCLDHTYTVLKTIRVQNISELKPFLEDRNLNVKILHLVRDPRAVMNSRRRLNEQNQDLIRRKGFEADEVLDLCDHMKRLLELEASPPEWLQGRYVRVRFEDVAADPIGQTRRMYDKLGIELHDDVISWIRANTHAKEQNLSATDPFSRNRDSAKVIDAWRKQISRRTIQRIQTTCGQVMNELLYKNVTLTIKDSINRNEQPSLNQIKKNVLSKPSRLQLIIVTSKRSGSSFVGELFNANPEVFYVYEPLYLPMKYAMENSSQLEFTSIAMDVWNHTLRCNFTTVSPPSRTWLLRPDVAFDSCKSIRAIQKSSLLCPVKRIPEYRIGPIVSNVCHDHPYTVFKTIRVQDISELKPFLEDRSLNVKILHLVRDPRAVMNSRWSLNQENVDLVRRKGPEADEVLDLCEHTKRNLALGSNPPEWLKGRYVQVRFEDLAKDPIGQTKALYARLGMELNDDVLTWIRANTHEKQHPGKIDPYGKTRDSAKVIDAWRNQLSPDLIERIETTCQGVMDDLLYERASLTH